MPKFFPLILSIFLCFIICLPISAQSKRQLQNKKKHLYTEIDIAKKLLDDTKSNKTSSINDLVLLEKKISNREEIIQNINQNISLLNKSIAQTNIQIDSLNQQITLLKNEYAEMARNAYLTQGSYNKLLFLFSSDDFNEAYQRFKYMQYYRDYREIQLQQIFSTTNTIQEKLQFLEQEKQEQEGLLNEQQTSKKTLGQEKAEKDRLVKELKKKEKDIKRQITKKSNTLNELDQQIQAIIAKATRKKQEEAKKANKSTIPKSQANIKLSNSFAKNKGKLPWPVEKGVITGRFGKNKHPVLKNITTTNNGIDIRAAKGTQVRAVFEGQVTTTLFNPSFQNAIIVKHGDYFSVYSNLKKVNVSIGDKITTQQAIGIAYTDPADQKTEIHLEIWKGSTKLNPIHWIYRK